MKYLNRKDRCQVTENNVEHGGRKGSVHGIVNHSPEGTGEILTKVVILCKETGELFDVDKSCVVKLDLQGEPVPYVESKIIKKSSPTIFGGKREKAKKSYPDRIIDWGEFLRFDLHDGSTLVRPHASSTDRWDNSQLVADLNRDGNLKEMHPKHKGWVVRPLDSDEDDWLFVSSLKEAEEIFLPFCDNQEYDAENIISTHPEVSG